MNEQATITIQLHCRDLPGASFDGRTGVRLGIQQGREVVDDVSAAVESVTFTFPLRVTKHPQTGKPNFLGPFAQGTAEERFVYLCWGERPEGLWAGFSRAKIHLKHLTWNDLEKPLATGEPIAATLRLTDKRGGPLCASVKAEHIEWQL